MKQTLVVLAIIVLADCSSVPKTTHPASQAAAAAALALAGSTFTGTIVDGHMRGSMARPHVPAEIQSEGGRTALFNLRRATAVTDVNGKPISLMRRFKKGFTIKDGQNEAGAWNYLD